MCPPGCYTTQHSPLLANLAVARARVFADDPLGMLHGFDGPEPVVLEVVAVHLEIYEGYINSNSLGQVGRSNDNTILVSTPTTVNPE